MGKGKKKSKKEKKGGGGNNMSAFREAILGFHLEARQKLTDEIQAEVNELQSQNERYRERNVRLKQEHFDNFQTLLKKTKAQEMEIEQNQMYNSSHVEQALKSKWDLETYEEAAVEAIMEKLKTVEKEAQEAEAKLAFLQFLKADGGAIEQKKIDGLETVLADMKKTFEYMRDSIKRQLDQELRIIETKTKARLEEEQDLASEKAIEQLDGGSLQEVHENKWLCEEVEIHRVEYGNLQQEVEKLEEGNLKIISQLLDCQESDLKTQTTFCAHDAFDPTESILKGDLMMDLNKMSIYKTECSNSSDSDDEDLCKCKSMPTRLREEIFGPGHMTGISVDFNGDIESNVIANQDESISLEEDEDFLLGPMEVRLLHIAGESMAIHPSVNTSSTTNQQQQLQSKQQVNNQKRNEIQSRAKWVVEESAYKALMEKKVVEGNQIST